MLINNPFTTYKIYSITAKYPGAQIPLGDKTSIVCIIAASESKFEPFLKKILNAVKIMEDAVEIVALDNEEKVSAADQDWFVKLDYIFCFGIPISCLQVQSISKPYTRTKIRDTIIFQVPLLSIIESNQNEKQKLWNMLKKEFLYE